MSINESYILSDSDVLGTFDFITYNIFMCVDDISFIKNIKNTDDILSFENSAELYSIMFHEYRHYYDMTHSVYGFNYLKKMNNALSKSLDSKTGDEFTYFAVKEFTNDVKKIRYPKYYNLVFKEHKFKKWQLKHSIGKIFNSDGKVSDRPVLFAKYYDEKSNLLARHPFSMVSLLECSATTDEYISLIALINKSYENKPANKGRLIKKLEEKALNYIYDIGLVEYSTCFHMVANHFQQKELQKLFEISRILLDICLNFTDTHFELIEKSNLVDKLFRVNPAWNNQEYRDYIDFQIVLKSGLKYKERPILFYVLLNLMNRDSNSDIQSIISEINRILKDTSLDILKIFEDSKKVISFQADILKNSKIEYFSLIANSVMSNLIISEKDQDDGFDKYFKNISEYLYKLDMPSFEILGSFISLKGMDQGVFAGINYETKFKQITELKKWVDEFDEACFY